jgi:hypothetical protein
MFQMQCPHMSRAVSPKRWTTFFDEHGRMRECKISFSMKLQSPIETPISEPLAVSSSSMIVDRFFCSEQIAEGYRHPSVKVHAFKRKITFVPSDRQWPKRCTVQFSLQAPTTQEIACSDATTERSRTLYPAAFVKFGGFNLHAPKTFGCRAEL